MYVVKVALLFILVFIPSIACVLTETLQNFSTFCHFSFEGGGSVFLSDINILTPPLSVVKQLFLYMPFLFTSGYKFDLAT